MSISTHLNKMPSVALIGVAFICGAVGTATTAKAQESISVPSGLCSWNWSSPASDGLLARLAARDDFNRNMRYVTEQCPSALCGINWANPGAKAAMEELGGKPYFARLVNSLGQACPEVAALLTEGATATVPGGGGSTRRPAAERTERKAAAA